MYHSIISCLSDGKGLLIFLFFKDDGIGLFHFQLLENNNTPYGFILLYISFCFLLYNHQIYL